MKTQKTQCTTYPSPFPLHIHTVHVSHFHLAADFQLNRSQHFSGAFPSVQSGKWIFLCWYQPSGGWGVGLKTFSMGRLCITYNPLPFFLYTILNRKGTCTPFSSFVLPSEISTLSYTV